jgi:sec-independent protein translocase protein TatB
MFDIGAAELFLIAIVALIVLGPERLPKAARFAGLWVRRARAQWYSVRSELERELAADELKRSLQEGRDAVRDIESGFRSTDEDMRREFDAIRNDVEAMRPQTKAPPSDDQVMRPLNGPVAKPDTSPDTSDVDAQDTADVRR